MHIFFVVLYKNELPFLAVSVYHLHPHQNMTVATKLLLVLALFAGAKAGYLGGYDGGHGGYEGYGGGHHEEYHEPAKYSFNYAVHDPHTGDEKQHQEERYGDQVKGSYSLKEADGTTRIVHKIGEPKQEYSYGGGYGYGHGGEGGYGHYQ
ncbi:unnamed protein product [Brassicogethes aeneus]|uniref:Uncharacterized protein n=1 Tax=Brassicogethes aeneus TaxID=1431903 RepID=A0A9P0B007_BRAAE|nr:unnamed protein product [Brassicogethes aeneus]